MKIKINLIASTVLILIAMVSCNTKSEKKAESINIKKENTMSTKTKVKYFIEGNGPKKVIVTHDWMGDTKGNWKHAISYLDKDKFTYAFMDVRGYGQSKDVKGDFTINEIASDYFDLADDLGWDKFYLIGHSMCGMAAQKATLMDKDNRILAVIGITPVSSAGFPVDDDTKAFFEGIITDHPTATTGYGMLVSDKLSKNWNEMRASRLHAQTNPEAVKSYMDEWLTQNFYDEMKGAKKPYYVIYGEDDLEAWREAGQKEAFKYFENVSFDGITNAGHYPMQQVPARTVSLIEAFINYN